ncbi:MAG: nuclear transport factor 2 family protein [Acidimicrobiales bacterium]|nr:nuclear transport factor 2 family protein [Acidimicrobiales bacterium]MDP6298511.1 nuclear transport factor 2 family protein [Acidimicrobiales bacterium]HJM96792.1 nuclear transport factor 2 family protein [Acidimicrobiales bacterium]
MDAVTEIRNLIFRYARAIDAGQFSEIGALFSRGKILLNGTEGDAIIGETAVTALYEATTRRYDDGTPRTHHLTSNVEVNVEQDQASSVSYFTVFQALPGFDLQPIISGKYLDTFALCDDGWFFETRTMEVTLTGDLSKHLLIDLTEKTE